VALPDQLVEATWPHSFSKWLTDVALFGAGGEQVHCSVDTLFHAHLRSRRVVSTGYAAHAHVLWLEVQAPYMVTRHPATFASTHTVFIAVSLRYSD
jgi:hypothetical protein